MDLHEGHEDGEPCPQCEGVGSVRVIYGDEEGAAPCPGCGGAGRVMLQGDGTRDLRLVPEIDRDSRDLFGSESGAEAA